MRITPLAYINKQNLYSAKQINMIRPMFCGDSFESHNTPMIFNAIESETAQKLYNSDFVTDGKTILGYRYPTFVFNRDSGKPVEVVVLPNKIDKNIEEYYVYETKNPLKKDICKLGRVYINYDINTDSLETETMSSYGKEMYQGLGIRLHQIALERMLAKDYGNYILTSLPEAYDFHKKCGFQAVKDENYYDFNSFSNLLSMYAQRLNISENEVKDMMVYKKEDENRYFIDLNTSFEKFVEYGKRTNSYINSCFSVDMKLSEAALNEWKIFIRKNPIFPSTSNSKFRF